MKMEIQKSETDREFNNLMYRLGPAFASDRGFKNAQDYIKLDFPIYQAVLPKNGIFTGFARGWHV